MPVYPITHYARVFMKLRVDRSTGAPAPHKPVLLLAVIQGIAQKEITDNRIYITPQLLISFQDIWKALVQNPHFKANFSLPFYHLHSSKVWHLHTHPDKEILLTHSRSVTSFTNLQDAVAYASLDEELFRLLSEEESRNMLRSCLLFTYFNKHSESDLIPAQGTVDTLSEQMLTEPPTRYRLQAWKLDEEERFIRKEVFKKLVPSIYNYTCCITGMRIISTYQDQMIDACHIVPFSLSHDDTISNGISLCPNMHRAFDRGLIAIDDNYTVLLSTRFTEQQTAHSLRQYEGKQILLPSEHQYLPAIDNLNWHRDHIFKY